MSFYASLSRLTTQWRSDRSRTRTQRILDALPPEIRKDIGWPQSNSAPSQGTTGDWM